MHVNTVYRIVSYQGYVYATYISNLEMDVGSV